MAIEELFGDDPNASTPANGSGKNGGPKPAAKAKAKAAVASAEPLTDPFAEEAPAPAANADFEALTAESSSEPSGGAPLMAAPTSPAATAAPRLPERIAEAVKNNGSAQDMFAGEGLTFERRYTRVGEDVYSTTEWDYRTAAITGEGGNVVFEQKDCEIPKAWSMLATNVVVSKYFRGKVGTPDREHSVKQLISRVADTIYKWGKKDNYFATDTDADAFHDELKYLLLHQYMAFNSPVWFNLGVPGEKAQISACFINSVDDTMESILTLAKTEGMLFKWGSGTGTNLSVLRSSQEGLKGGGTASGPVSFMRGFDAFAGAIKCLTPDAYVYTDQGLVTLDKVIDTTLPPGFHENNSVVLATKDGPTRISHVYVSPKAETYQVTLAHTNLGLRGTADHPILTLTPDFELAWKRLPDLVRGDRVAVSRRSELWPHGAPSFADFVPTTRYAKKKLSFPREMTPALARLLGYMVSEGCMDEERFRFCSCDADTFADFLSCVENVFGVAPSKNVRPRVHSKTGVTTWMFEACWTNAVRFLKYVGLTTAASDAKTIPWSVRQSPRSLVTEFLRAYFEGDGHVSTHVYAASASKQLLSEVQLLLLNMGMLSALRPHPVNGKMYWSLYLRGEQAWSFVREVGFVSARKKAMAQFVGDKNTNTNIDTIPFLVDNLRACTNKNGYFRCADGVTRFVGFGFFNRKAGSGISYNRLRSTPDLVDKVRVVNPDWADTLETILKGEFFWDSVASVATAEAAVTYDFTVPETHSFVANGIVNHNSGGKTRRAAKMVILNADHPDIEEFIECKADAEKKAHSLIEAGYSGAFNVPNGAYDSVFFQNANHSVRATDDFMRAVELDRDWSTVNVLDGTPAKTLRARDLMHKIAQATWFCGDPGMQFDTTANRWHTCPNTARINASNPCCITGDTKIAVADGRNAVAIRDLAGQVVPVYVWDHAAKRTVIAAMHHIEIKRQNAPVYRVTLDDGSSFRATDDHLIMLKDGSYRQVKDLNAGDSLNPFHSQVKQLQDSRSKRRYVYSGKGWKAQYRWIWQYANGAAPEGFHIHHRDFDSLNDRSVNLELMRETDHRALHTEQMLGDRNPARRLMNDAWGANISRAVSGESNPNFGRTHGEPTREAMRIAAAQRWADPAQHEAMSETAKARIQSLRDAGKRVGRTPGERCERCCPACRQNFVTAREEQIFCGNECRYSPLGRGMVGAKGGESRRGYVPSPEHREKLRLSSQAASRPEDKRRAQEESLRSRCLKASRLLMDAGIEPTLAGWDDLRGVARELGAAHVPQSASLARFFPSDAELREHTALYNHKVVSVEFDGNEDVYDGTVDDHHNFGIVTSETSGGGGPDAPDFSGCFIHNSEFFFLDDTACNLASLNLMRFRTPDREFNVEEFKHAVRITITAQEIMVGNAAYPTDKITVNSFDYRPLGLGYANLGALLMARGLAYDSDEGRAYAAAITAILSGEAYHQSAKMAGRVGAFAGYERNKQPMQRVVQMHRDHVEAIERDLVPEILINEARSSWDKAIEVGRDNGYRNSQISVLAPTGCLVADSLVLTDRGLMRLNRLGNVNGKQWQDVNFRVLTDEGPKDATKFYVNGIELTRRIVTKSGYAIQGTLKHRIKVVEAATGEMVWKRFSDIAPGDVVALSMGALVGEPRVVKLPPLGEEYWTGDYTTRAPRTMTPELAELIGYFMGDGSLHTKGPRFCVANTDEDVAQRVKILLKSLFNLDAHITPQGGYQEVTVHSVPLTMWWEACGFAKYASNDTHSGKGYVPHVPDAVLATNDPAVYGAFLRGLYEADGTVTNGVPCWTTTQRSFSEEVKTLALALGLPTVSRETVTGWGNSTAYVLRLRNSSYAPVFQNVVGFMGARKASLVTQSRGEQTARHDYIYLGQALVDELISKTHALRNAADLSVKRHNGAVTRRTALALLAETGDRRLAKALGFFYDTVKLNEDGGEQLTYDLSVPENVTYIAQGFISHNTIGFLMDCDTTGVEPDIAIVKYKSLVGGGMFKIVNQTVPEALERLGYSASERKAILEYIEANDTIEGAPGLAEDHLSVFDCAFRAKNGTRTIHYLGHIKMMSAVQPFISGAISKTVNMPHDAVPEEIAEAYLQAWKLGIKALAIYRDGSKKTQPLSTGKASDADKKATPVAAAPAEARPLRRKLPDERQSLTHKFSVGGHEGYITIGLYPDQTPGEIFITMSKEGSVVSGLMDSFATSISLALQYGVPLRTLVEKFMHTRFEPSGFTGNPDIPMAKSIMDYLFRYVALKFLDKDERAHVGLIADQQDEYDNEGTATPVKPAASAPSAAPSGAGQAGPAGTPSANGESRSNAAERQVFVTQADAPPCPECGSITSRNGACYRCSNCGTSIGCS